MACITLLKDVPADAASLVERIRKAARFASEALQSASQ
jgi:hypothetical protein